MSGGAVHPPPLFWKFSRNIPPWRECHWRDATNNLRVSLSLSDVFLRPLPLHVMPSNSVTWKVLMKLICAHTIPVRFFQWSEGLHVTHADGLPGWVSHLFISDIVSERLKEIQIRGLKIFEYFMTYTLHAADFHTLIYWFIFIIFSFVLTFMLSFFFKNKRPIILSRDLSQVLI